MLPNKHELLIIGKNGLVTGSVQAAGAGRLGRRRHPAAPQAGGDQAQHIGVCLALGPEHSGGQGLGGDGLLGWAVGDELAVEKGQAVKTLDGQVEVMGRNQDRHPLAVHTLDDLQDGLLGGRIFGFEVLEDVSPVRYLGNEIVRKHPVVKDWMIASPVAVAIDSVKLESGYYSGLKNVRLIIYNKNHLIFQ